MEYFPLILVGGFPDAFPDVTDDQSGRSGGHGFFLHSWGGGDPMILYNINRVWVKMVYFLRYRQIQDSPLILIGRFL